MLPWVIHVLFFFSKFENFMLMTDYLAPNECIQNFSYIAGGGGLKLSVTRLDLVAEKTYESTTLKLDSMTVKNDKLTIVLKI